MYEFKSKEKAGDPGNIYQEKIKKKMLLEIVALFTRKENRQLLLMVIFSEKIIINFVSNRTKTVKILKGNNGTRFILIGEKSTETE